MVGYTLTLHTPSPHHIKFSLTPTSRPSMRLLLMSMRKGLYRYRLVYLLGFFLCCLHLPAQPPDGFDEAVQLMKTNSDSGYTVLLRMLNQGIKKNEPLTDAICFQQIGLVFYNNSNFPQSVDYFLRAEKIFREYKQPASLAKNLNLLGMVYYANKQPSLAARQFDEAMQISTRLNDLAGMALTYGNIGYLYEKKLNYDSAYIFQRKALDLYRQASDSMGMAKIFENLGSIFEDRSNFDSAGFYFQRALTINKKYGDEIAQIEILNNLGDVSRKAGQYENGLVYTRKALQLATKTDSKYQLSSAYRDMAKGFELIGRFDSAYYYNELSRDLIKSIYSSTNNQQIALLETVYEVEKKNNQIARLAADKRLDMVTITAIVIVIILLVVLASVIISRQRLKIKNDKKNRQLMEVSIKNQQLEEEQLRQSLETLSRELSSHTLHIIQKNQLLEELRGSLEAIVNDEKRDHKKQLQQLSRQIQNSFNHDEHWKEFSKSFEQVHQQFLVKLRSYSDDLTSNDLRLIALIKLNISSADIASLLNISTESLRVSRYRLRKKLGLAQGESLTNFVQYL